MHDQNDEIDLKEIISAFWRRKWTFLIVFISTIILSFFYSLLEIPQFHASGTIKVSDSSIPIRIPRTEFQQTQLEILKSTQLLERTAESILSKNDATFFEENRQSNIDKNNFLSKIIRYINKIIPNKNQINILTHEEKKIYLFNLLKNNLKITSIKNTEFFKLNFNSPNPDLSAQTINIFTDEYIKTNTTEFQKNLNKTNNIDANINILNDQIKNAELELESLNEKKEKLSEKSSIGSYDIEKEIILNKLKELDFLSAQAYTDRILFENIYKTNLKDNKNTVPNEHTQQIQSEYAAILQVEKVLEKEIISLREKAATLEAIKPQYDLLDRQILSYNRIYDELLFQLNKLLSSTHETLATIQVIDAASPPLSSKSKSQLILLLGIMLGTMLGGGAVLVKEFFDHSIKSTEEFAKLFSIPILGHIVLGKKILSDHSKINFLLIEEPNTSTAKAIRAVITSLRLKLPAKKPTNLLFVGFDSGNHATALAINCALSYLGEGRCLLIDANSQKKTLSKNLNLHEENIGFSNIVNGQTKLADAAQPIAKYPGLDAIPSGFSSTNSAVFMADKTSREFLTDASKTYATTIFDAPQPQDFDEILTLVSMMDGIVLIVTEGKTQRDEIEQFKTLLTQVNSNLFGVIIKEC